MTHGQAGPVSPDHFPLRLAAMDLGSNALRFVAAEFEDASRFRRLSSVRAAVRLGHDVFRFRRLTEHTLDRAVVALRDFRRRLDKHRVTRHRAVATSAVRESENGAELVERVREEAGIEIEPITGEEEAWLVWRAIRSRLDLGHGEWILIDVGGGSVEISRTSADDLLWSESHPVGTVRLLEELGGAATEDPAYIRTLLADQRALLRIPPEPGAAPISGVVATGGNAEALADMVGAADPAGCAAVMLRDLDDLIDRLAGMAVPERMSQLGLRRDRADVILPAAIFYQQVAARAGADRFLVPRVGLREGVLLDLLRRS